MQSYIFFHECLHLFFMFSISFFYKNRGDGVECCLMIIFIQHSILDIYLIFLMLLVFVVERVSVFVI